MKGLSFFKKSHPAGFTLVQTTIATSILVIVLGAAYTGGTALLSSLKASENYSVGQLMAVDYLSLDLRRASDIYAFNTSDTTLTLPLTLYLPQYYSSNGKTPNVPQRVLITSSNQKDKKKHKVFSAKYYYTYGAFDSKVAVQYSLSNGTLYRKEGTVASNGTFVAGTLPARAVGTGIASVTFSPDIASIKSDPVVTATITFSPTQRAKQAPTPLSVTTFMRQYYYSDYN